MAVYETKLTCLKQVGLVYYLSMVCLHIWTNNLSETCYFKKYQLLAQVLLDLLLNSFSFVIF